MRRISPRRNLVQINPPGAIFKEKSYEEDFYEQDSDKQTFFSVTSSRFNHWYFK